MNRCPICKQTVGRLTKHLATAHQTTEVGSQSNPLLHCPVCYESFAQDELKAHVQGKHADSRGSVHGIRRGIVGGPGKISHGNLVPSDGEKEYLKRKREEKLDRQVIAQVKARRNKH